MEKQKINFKKSSSPAGKKRYFSPKKNKGKSKNREENIKICFLGGLEAVGEKNMAFIEYKGQIVVLDAGLMFPDANMPGIDYVIPNVDYLEKNKKKIVGLFITHGHYDHIGAIPYIMDKIGNPVIYAAPLTKAIILKRQSDFPNSPKLKIQEIKTDKLEGIKVGQFIVHPFVINHNIPDSLGFAVETDKGSIFYVPDFKFDFTPVVDEPADLKRITKLAGKNPLLLMADSSGAERPGYAPSEKKIHDDLERIFEKAKGKRIIAATFASLLNRVQQLIWISEKFGRRVVIDGFSMKANVAIARESGYLKVERNTFISPEEANALPKGQVTILCTGSQGEDRAVLMRMANFQHRYFKVGKDDVVVFSSSVIPGNESSIQNLRDAFYRQDAEVYHYKMMDIHTSGHGNQEDIKLLLSLIRPKFYMPIHGNYSMLKLNADLAYQTGISKENVLIAQNGQVVNLSPAAIKISEQRVPANYIMVDGLGVGDVGEVVLRDRNQLAQDGTIVIVAMVDGQLGQIKGEPEITARGFAYAKGKKGEELKNKISEIAKDIISKTASKDRTTNWGYIKDNLRDKIGEYISRHAHKRPIILPFIVEI